MCDRERSGGGKCGASKVRVQNDSSPVYDRLKPGAVVSIECGADLLDNITEIWNRLRFAQDGQFLTNDGDNNGPRKVEISLERLENFGDRWYGAA